MTPLLLPRLDRDTALVELTEMRGATAADLRGSVRTTHPGQHWYPLGNRVVDQTLGDLRRELEALADRFGFPTALSTIRGGGRHGQADWDRDLGRLLADHLSVDRFPGLEHPDVWTWFGLALAPDLIAWRWGWPEVNPDWKPGGHRRAYERWLGTLRQGLRRPWYRTVQYADPGGLYPDLLEDHLVQIEERPSLGADPAVGRQLLDGISQAYTEGVLEQSVESAVREKAVRHAAKIVLAENTVLPLWVRGPGELRATMVHLIGEGVAIEQNRPVSPWPRPVVVPQPPAAAADPALADPPPQPASPAPAETPIPAPERDGAAAAASRWLDRVRRRR